MTAPGPDAPVDTVSEADETIGRLPRGRVLAEGANFRVAHIFVFNRAGELLIQRLSPLRERHPLRWGSSVAAYLHSGETPWKAAQRRLREELGLETPLRMFVTVPMRDTESLKFVTLFTTTAAGPRMIDSRHIAEVQFVPLETLFERVDDAPDEFTDTFRFILEVYRRTRRPPSLAIS